MLISKILHSKYSDSETKFQTKSIENKELTLETTKVDIYKSMDILTFGDI